EVLDEGAAGAIDGLAEKGFRKGKNLILTRFNAHGDVGTATTIAREILREDGPYDLVITMSTCSLQAVAANNNNRSMTHAFGRVPDPFTAGVGLDRANPKRHPPYLVGQGILLPVDECFRLARQMNPELKSVGVVWNPSEDNSRLFIGNAQKACKTLGIDL